MIFCTATLTSVIGKSFGDESPFLLVKLLSNSEILIGKMYQKHWPIHHVYFFLEKKITFIRFPSSSHVELLPIQCHPVLVDQWLNSIFFSAWVCVFFVFGRFSGLFWGRDS